MEALRKNKLYIVAATVLVVVVSVFGIMASRSDNKPTEAKTKQIVKEEDDYDKPIPTVDSSVEIVLKPLNDNREVEISIAKAPSGTKTVDVEMSYETADQSLEGVIGEIRVADGSGSQKFTLGTCSSGTCRYHKLASDIKLVLKFNGDYGEKILEKSYSL